MSVKEDEMCPVTRPTTDEEQVCETNWILDYGILKVIFENLNIRDLFSSARVCKLWHEVSQIVRKQRINKPTTMLYHMYPMERTREVVQLSNSFDVPEATRTWIQDPMTTPRQSSLEIPVVKEKILHKDLEAGLWKAIDNQFSEPCQIICIGSHNLSDYVWKTKHERSSSDYPYVDGLFRRMGKVSPCLAALGYGVILTLPDSALTCLEDESRFLEHPFFPTMCGLAIPRVNGLKISMFSYGMDTVGPKVTAENCEQVLNISPEDNVKGIVLFQSLQKQRKGTFILRAIHEYLKKHPNVAFGGGDFVEVCTNQPALGCGLVISGDENVRVGSAAFLERGMSEANLLQLRKFKEFGLTGSADFAFMFSCTMRGSRMHRAEHVESSLFRSEYPTVPLIGGFTGGEYFHPYIQGQPDPPQVLSDKSPSFKFTHSTSFVYVSCTN